MLTQLLTLKNRLAIDQFNLQYDTILTNTIKALSTRFDLECNRTFSRTVSATHEFPAGDTEITPPCYPIEFVTKFELKENETTGWVEQTSVDFLIRKSCIISLSIPFSYQPASFNAQPAIARVTYTGGFVLPGTTVGAGQTALPDDLEQAVVEQAAAWFMNRDKIGRLRYWPKGGIYEEFSKDEFLPSVQGILKRYTRFRL